MVQQFHIAEWSSSVARRAHNPKVVGSNPASATIKTIFQMKDGFLFDSVSIVGYRRNVGRKSFLFSFAYILHSPDSLPYNMIMVGNNSSIMEACFSDSFEMRIHICNKVFYIYLLHTIIMNPICPFSTFEALVLSSRQFHMNMLDFFCFSYICLFQIQDNGCKIMSEHMGSSFLIG